MSKTTILIVEDEAIVAADLANKLVQLGYEISGTTASGEEAVDLAQRLRPKLVLMDIRLGGAMDGVEAAGRIRQDCGRPVIFITAHSDRATLRRAKLTEPYGYILKPFEELDLETHIQMALYKHQAETQLRQSEERYRMLFDRNPDGVFAVDASGRFLAANPACEGMSGYSLAELLQKRFAEVCAPDQAAATTEEFERVWRESGRLQLETAFLRKNGARVEVWIAGEPILADGRTVAVHCTARDITARKRADDALRFLVACGSVASGEDFFQALARYLARTLSMDLVCVDRLEPSLLAARTVAVYADGKFDDNVSYALQDTPGGQVVGKTICCFAAGVRGRFPQDIVLQQMKAESYAGATLWGSQGQPIGLIALIGRQPLADPEPAKALLRLVAVRAAGELERRQAEEALRRSNARLDLLAEIARELLESDAPRSIVGPLCRRVLAFLNCEVFFNFLVDESTQRLRLNASSGLSPEDAAALSTTPEPPSDLAGSYGILACASQPLLAKGKRIGTLCFGARNRTRFAEEEISLVEAMADQVAIAIDRQCAEEALRRARDELEARVQERTTDLRGAVDRLRAEMRVREQAEAALRESEERYRVLVESAPLGIALTDLDGRMRMYNRALCLMLGLSAEELRTRNAQSFYVRPADRGLLLRRLQARGQATGWRTRLRRADGSEFAAVLSVSRIKLGAETLLLATTQDISRRSQAEWHLEGVRRLLELFATKASRAEYLRAVVKLLQRRCDCHGVAIRLVTDQRNLPFAAHSGFSRDFLQAERLLGLQPAGCACMRALLDRREPGLASCYGEAGSFFCSNTARFAEQLRGLNPVEPSLACVSAGYQSIAVAAIRHRGKFVGIVQLADARPARFSDEIRNFIHSVTPLLGEALQRFTMEEALKEREERFRGMFEKHEAAMLLVDPETSQVVEANAAAATFFGSPQERLRSLHLEELGMRFPRSAAAARRKPVAEAARQFETSARLSSGEVRRLEVHASLISVQGQPRLFAIIHDVTERKRLEKRILEIGDAERRKVGRDLHDSLGGHLTGIALLGGALAQSLAAQASPQAAIAAEVVQGISEAIAQTRMISQGLCPVEAGEHGLLDGLQLLTEDVRRRARIDCQFQAGPGLGAWDPFIAEHVFRIAQEAVTNALRHAQPSRIVISLARVRGGEALTVWNDGKPLPETAAAGPGLGMRTMQFRANAIGAELAIQRLDGGGGTLVSCVLPALRETAPHSADEPPE